MPAVTEMPSSETDTPIREGYLNLVQEVCANVHRINELY